MVAYTLNFAVSVDVLAQHATIPIDKNSLPKRGEIHRFFFFFSRCSLDSVLLSLTCGFIRLSSVLSFLKAFTVDFL